MVCNHLVKTVVVARSHHGFTKNKSSQTFRFSFKEYYVVCKTEECHFSKESNCLLMDKMVKYGLDDSPAGCTA